MPQLLYSNLLPGSCRNGLAAYSATLSFNTQVRLRVRSLASTRPLVWLMISLTVIGCRGNRGCSLPPAAATRWPLNSGRYFSTGSSICSLPSSTSIINAVAVSDLLIDAIQNRLSVRIGALALRLE